MLHQFSGQRWQALEISIRNAPFKANILPVDVAETVQCLHESVEVLVVAR